MEVQDQVKWFNVWHDTTWLSEDKLPLKSVSDAEAAKQIADLEHIRPGFIFWGGADIATSLYNQKPLTPEGSETLSERDKAEVLIYLYAKMHKIPVIGICRGAQLVHVLNHGKLWQHSIGHNNADHKVTIIHKNQYKEVVDSSDHHQIMIGQPNYEGRILGFSTHPTELLVGKNEWRTSVYIPEIIHYPASRSLCIQGHPEWCVGTPYEKICRELVQATILAEKPL